MQHAAQHKATKKLVSVVTAMTRMVTKRGDMLISIDGRQTDKTTSDRRISTGIGDCHYLMPGQLLHREQCPHGNFECVRSVGNTQTMGDADVGSEVATEGGRFAPFNHHPEASVAVSGLNR